MFLELSAMKQLVDRNRGFRFRTLNYPKEYEVVPDNLKNAEIVTSLINVGPDMTFEVAFR